jgi:predicted LPLAT superfamily acyltransferase
MNWAGQRERGSALLLGIMFWIIRHLGWHVGQALLYPIILWFYAGSPAARAASRDYLARVLDHEPGAWDVLRHLFTFGCVILDRVFFLSGRTAGYELTVQGLEAVTDVVNAGRGCILLGSHLGSFDVLRALGRTAPVRVSPVMFRLNSGHLTRLLEALDPELARDVIEIGAPGAMLRVQECIERGEIVGFLADRAPVRDRMVATQFLGGEAEFPAGPLILASIIGAPVVLFYGVRTASRRYVIQFERFAERIVLPRKQREAELQAWIDAYGRSLAAACRAYPYNWFNFFSFWKTAAGRRALPLALLLLTPLPFAPGAAQAASLAETVMAQMAALPSRTAGFVEEKRLASLTTPLVSRGHLVFTQPSRLEPSHLEKDTETPKPERLVIDGDQLTIAGDGAAPRSVALDEYPALRALADTLRAALGGDLATLRRLYAIEEQGTPQAWRLLLMPRQPALRRALARVTLDGGEADLRQLVIQQANGDEQRMTIQTPR